MARFSLFTSSVRWWTGQTRMTTVGRRKSPTGAARAWAGFCGARGSMSCPNCLTFSVVRWASSDRAHSFPIKSGSSRKEFRTTDNVGWSNRAQPAGPRSIEAIVSRLKTTRKSSLTISFTSKMVRSASCMTPDEFLEDLRISKAILEAIVGKPALGYRAAGFSVRRETPWFFEKVIEAGYAYDSSVFPASRAHGGLKTEKLGPHVIHTSSGRLLEFPIPVQRVMGPRLCFFGG